MVKFKNKQFLKSHRFQKLLVFSTLFVFLVTGLSSSTQVKNSGPAYDAGLNRAVGKITQQGGTLLIGSARDCDSLDPAQSFTDWCSVIQRLYTRNLLAFAGKPGIAGLELVPDLAIASPVVTEENKVWTFTLRDNLQWEDGSPITSSDVKFSFARLFDDLLQSPVSNETLCLISTCSLGTPDYLGPYIAEVGQIPTITTPDEKTVVIRLTRSFAEFDKIVATSNFGIVSQKRDNELRVAGIPYAQNPSSSGPFKLTYLNGAYKFIRNDKWNQDSDLIRFPQVDEISWTLYPDSESVDTAVINGDIDLRIDAGLGSVGREYFLSEKTFFLLVTLR